MSRRLIPVLTLLALATLFVVGMLLFLFEVGRQQRGYSARHHIAK